MACKRSSVRLRYSPPKNRLISRRFFLFMSYFVYIIYSEGLDRYYVGHTENVDVRLFQHNSGISTFTAKNQDWVLMYKQEFETREEARKREFEIKKKKSRKYIEWICSVG